MNPKNPDWLPEVRDMCRRSSISISGWGADTIIVEAKSPEQSAQASSLLRPFGFEPMPNEDDQYAGLLLLSRNPAATQQKQVSCNVTHRRWDEQIEPLIWAICSLVLILRLGGGHTRYPLWFTFLLEVLFLGLFSWEAVRIWGWRLELLPDAIRIRRRFQWSTIPWAQVQSVTLSPWRNSRYEAVALELAPHDSERLGVFPTPFSRLLRDRLRFELAQRRPNPH